MKSVFYFPFLHKYSYFILLHHFTTFFYLQRFHNNISEKQDTLFPFLNRIIYICAPEKMRRSHNRLHCESEL